MSMTKYMDPVLHDGKRYKVYYDDDYQVERSCGGRNECRRDMHGSVSGRNTPEEVDAEMEECEQFYRKEIEKLDAGDWVALFVVVEEPCPNPEPHCGECTGWVEAEYGSVGGCVYENSETVVRAAIERGDMN